MLPANVSVFPNFGRRPSSSSFGLESNTTVFQSPIGGATQTVEVPGAYWRGSVSYSNLQYEQARTLRTFLTSQRGRAGRFWFGDLSYEAPTVNMSWLIHTVTNRGFVTLSQNSTPTLPAGTVVLNAGDYIAFQYAVGTDNVIHRSLHMVTQRTAIQSTNLLPVQITPPLRTTPSLNASQTRSAYITMDDQNSGGLGGANAVTTFRLEEDSVMWSVRPPNIHSVQFAVIESFA